MTFRLLVAERAPSEFAMMQEATFSDRIAYKIAAHISMTRLAITTTIRMNPQMRFALVPNVAHGNSVFSLGVSPSLRIAAAIWIAPRIGSIENARMECLRFAVERLLEHFPGWELWLVAGHRTVQPDNRLTRHFGLWQSLENRGTDIPTGNFIGETLIPCEGGIRFFDAVRFAPEQLEKVGAVLTSESAAIVALDPSRSRKHMEELVAQGWSSTNTKPPEEILERVCSQGGVVLEIFGEFDDIEIGAAVMGKEELVADLNN